MRRHLLAVLILLLCAVVPVRAQDPPPIVTEGLNAYRDQGPAAALNAWLQGWPSSDQEAAKAQLLPALQSIRSLAGRATGHEHLGTAVIGLHVRRMYLVLLHERRPAFLRLDIYEVGGTWRVLNVTVNTNMGDVLPAELLLPRS